MKLVYMMVLLLLFLQKQSLAFAVYLFGIGTLLTGLGSKKKTHVIMFSPRPQRLPGDSPTPWVNSVEYSVFYLLAPLLLVFTSPSDQH